MQKFLGSINWIRPYLELTTSQLAPLFVILKDDPDLNSPRKLTPEKAALEIIDTNKKKKVDTNRHVYQIYPKIPCLFLSLIYILQLSCNGSDPLHVLEWVSLSHQPKKIAPTIFELITQLNIICHQRCLQLAAKDPSKIIIPVTQEQFKWCKANSISLQSALQNFSGQISYHLPSHKLLQFGGTTEISSKPLNSSVALKGITVFTNKSGKIEKAIMT